MIFGGGKGVVTFYNKLDPETSLRVIGQTGRLDGLGC